MPQLCEMLFEGIFILPGKSVNNTCPFAYSVGNEIQSQHSDETVNGCTGCPDLVSSNLKRMNELSLFFLFSVEHVCARERAGKPAGGIPHQDER